MMEISMRELADYAWSRGAEEYNFVSIHNCALCHFLRDVKGFKTPHVNPDQFCDQANYVWFPLAAEVETALVGRPRTFLALAGRLECALAEQEGTTLQDKMEGVA